jgi:hypothetical protein
MANKQFSKREGAGGGRRFYQIFLIACYTLQLFWLFFSWNHSKGGLVWTTRFEVESEPHYSRVPKVPDALVSHPFVASTTSAVSSIQAAAPPVHEGRLRILLGIVTADFVSDQPYRDRHRKLFALWNDPRVCTLADFKARPIETRYECQVIYTFVLGANPDVSPELVDDSRPMEVARPIEGICSDLNEPDMTLLNIRENMNEGKSQTWTM